MCYITRVFSQTPLDQQELICGQLAGVSRCVSELSSSPVRVLRLRRHKFAIHVKDDLFWVSERSPALPHTLNRVFNLKCDLLRCLCVFWQALGCPVEVPSISICQLLDQLINLFCFYNGSINLSYQVSRFVESTLFRADC